MEMFQHNWRLAEHTEDSADDRAVAEAQVDVLKAIRTLQVALRENSVAAANDRAELTGIIIDKTINFNAPFPQSFLSPERLEEDIGRMLRETSDAPTWLLLQFREKLMEGHISPDGMNPVRRAILDSEIRTRQDARRLGV